MNPFTRKLFPAVTLSLFAAMSFSGCETPGQSAMAGAAAGAAIGGLVSGTGRGAIRGAAIGAGGGYLVGRAVDQRRRDRYYEDDDRVYYGRAQYRETRRYPVGEPTNRYGFVTSPYRPYNLIDVRGIPHGAQVVDPSVNRIFINP